MGLLLDAAQIDLSRVVRSFMQKEWSTGALMDMVTGRENVARSLWPRLSRELDVIGLSAPEDLGGSDGSLVDLCVVLTEMGRNLYAGPYFATALLAVELLLASGDSTAAKSYVPRLCEGDLTAAVVGLQELAEGDDGQLPLATFMEGNGWSLTGTAHHVFDGDSAGLILVLGRTTPGVSVFIVEPTSRGLHRALTPNVDFTRPLAVLTFELCSATRLGAGDTDSSMVDRLLTVAMIGQAAEAIGAGERCLELAIDHAKTRVQFGQPIGSFQAVKHRCADSFVALEAAKASVQYAAKLVELGVSDSELYALNANAAAADALFTAATSAIQVHGGIGYTWEHPLHVYLRRALATRFLLGTPAAHRERMLQLRLASV
jgi:alkylation response protein AidB-like acyl-CoA dehydrogenase